MEYRRLGQDSLVVSAMGLGCMGMSEFYGATDDVESTATIHRAIDRGVTLLDTADVYGIGRNEDLVGRAIQGRRNQVVIATKFGILRDPANPTARGTSGKPEYVQKACEASLKRLQIPVIDLYYQHRVDPETPIEETVGAMARLVEQGKVRYLGLSEAAPQTIRRAHATHPIAALQSEYSLWERGPEAEILDVCRELGIGFVPYSPLGRGFLTGEIKAPTISPRTISAATTRGFKARTSRRIWISSRKCREWRPRRTALPPNSLLGGCLGKAATSCRSRAPNVERISTRTWMRSK